MGARNQLNIWRTAVGTRKATGFPVLVGLLILQALLPAYSCPCGHLKIPDLNAADFKLKEGLKFSYSKTYKQELAHAINKAREACLGHLGAKNVAVVCDIDETLLDNRPYFEQHEELNWDEFDHWVLEGKAPVIKPTADFLRWARSNGFAVFLVTGRKEKDRLGTIHNLIQKDIAYDGLYMRPDDDKRKASELKSEIRKRIEDIGFHIVVNIGDQYSDLAGGHAEDCEKVPNRIYLIR